MTLLSGSEIREIRLSYRIVRKQPEAKVKTGGKKFLKSKTPANN